jgi:hypothetical protein
MRSDLNINKMELVNCQKDKKQGLVVVQYKGEYNKRTTVEYVKRRYPQVLGKIIEVLEPTEFSSLKSYGVVLLW